MKILIALENDCIQKSLLQYIFNFELDSTLFYVNRSILLALSCSKCRIALLQSLTCRLTSLLREFKSTNEPYDYIP